MRATPLDEETVTRANVADVEIFNNESEFVFKEYVTVETLWPGIVNYLLNIVLKIRSNYNAQ